MTATPAAPTREMRRAAAAFAIDVLLILVFVIIGRRNHHEPGNAVVGTLKVAAPFAMALAVGWLVAHAGRAPLSLRTGLVAWACTVVIGFALRRLVFHRGIAIGFVVVATITLGVFLIGWRAIARATVRSA